MKQFTKRSLSVLLVLVMVLSAFSGLTFTASAQTGTLTTNTGVRHQVCTSLSAKAQAYYTGNYTYDVVSTLAGGNESCLASVDSPMAQRLRTLMTDTMTRNVSYDSLTSYWPKTDASGGSNNASLFYSDQISSSYNREHVWPKSRGSFLKTRAGCDLHHLRPTNTNVNSTRGNHTMGNVRATLSSYSTYQYGGNTVLYYNASGDGLVEVNDNIKGDVARILLYVYTRWEEPNLYENTPNPVIGENDDKNNGVKVIESLDTLLQWCHDDPVDEWEMGRNDQVENVQGNRNVFIDYPEYAWLMFGQQIPNDMPTPSGIAQGSGTSYSVTAVSNNNAYGTVSVSGRRITASPANGYYAAGYTVTSGSATVEQNGNVFTVTASSDCTIRINFAAKTAVALSFSVPSGVTQSGISTYAGEAVTLPTPNGTPTGAYSYTFLGWVAATVDNAASAPATIYAAGTDYTPTGNTTLYALYQYSVGGSSSPDYGKITTQAELTNGSYVIASAATGKALSTDVSSNWVRVGGTYSGDTISPAATDVWTYTDGVLSCDGGKLYTSGAKKVSLAQNGTTWTFELSGGKWTIKEGNNIMSYNSAGGFRTYSGGYDPDKTFYLYKGGAAGTPYYTTVIGAPCAHAHTEAVAAVAATCTEPGTTAGIRCTDCNAILSGCTATVATGHSWNAGVITTPATCSTEGIKTFTCNVCHETRTEAVEKTAHTAAPTYSSDANGHWQTCSVCDQMMGSKQGHAWNDGVVTTPATQSTNGIKTFTCTVCSFTRTESIPATGTEFTVSFAVPDGVAAVSSITGNSNEGITLPEADAPDTDHTFIGWTTAALETDSTTAPTYYPAFTTYNDGSATLIALYSYRQGGSGGGDYVKLTTTPNDIAGEYLIVYETGSLIFDSSLTTLDAVNNTQSVTIANDTISAAQGDACSVIVGTDGSILCKNGKYIGRSSYSNGLDARDTAQTHTITIAGGVATIKATGSCTLKFNKTSNQMRFRYYKSGQEAIALYRKSGSSGTTYYTTLNDASACIHTWNVGVVTTTASCTENGEKTFTCTKCGETRTEPIAASGHNYQETSHTDATCTAQGSTVSTCASCGDTVTTTLDALGHDYDNGVVTTEPTATTAGEMTFTCSRCDAAYTETIPALGEKIRYTRSTELTSGTEYILAFTHGGKFYAIGANLAPTEVTVVNDVISLDAGEAYLWTVAQSENGFTICHDAKYINGSAGTTLTVKSTTYDWQTVAGKTDGTFWFYQGSRGIGLYSNTSIKNYATSNATNSGTSYTFDLYLFSNTCAHTNATSAVTTEPSCIATGTTTWTCPTCGEHWTTSEPAALGHDFVLVPDRCTPATCESAGNNYSKCSRCQVGKNESIPVLGHDYQITESVAATCTQDGHTTYVCSHDAAHTYTEQTSAIGHHYTSVEITTEYEKFVCDHCNDVSYVYNRSVSFVVPEGIDAIDTMTVREGDLITLPAPTGTLTATAQNYVFTGWTVETVTDTTGAVEYHEAGEQLAISADTTFNALYRYVGEGSFGGENIYQLVTDLSVLDSGFDVVIANDGIWQSKTMAMAGFTDNGEKLKGANVTVSNGKIKLSETTSVQIFTLQKLEDGSFRFASDLTDNNNNTYYLASCSNTASANNIALRTTQNDASRWTLSFYEGKTDIVKMTACGTYTANTVLFNSSNYGGFFSCYGETYYNNGNTPSNIYGIRLFASNPVYHFTTQPQKDCEHTELSYADNGNGTHTVSCDNVLCGYTAVVAHTNGDATVVAPATCTAEGQQKFTCTLCGGETISPIEALGHEYTEEITTPATCSAQGEKTFTCGRCGDTYTEAIAATEHTFVNGSCSVCHASLFVRVTEAPENWEGEYLLVYVGSDGAYVFDGKNDAANNYTVGIFYGETGNEANLICVANPDDYALMFAPAGSGYNIMNANADWWNYSSAKNGFSVGSAPATYTISLGTNGEALVKNSGNYNVKFNTQAMQFRFYGTSIYTSVYLYEKFGTCHHNWQLDAAAGTPATCTNTGTAVYNCTLCNETKNETIPALQHDYQYNTVAPTCTEDGYTEVTCSRCEYNDIPTYSIVTSLGHDFSVEPATTDEDHYIAPTATTDGLMYYKCSRCDVWSTEGIVIPALGVVTSKTYTMLTAADFDSYDTALANVGQFILVAEADGVYYAMSASGNGTVLNAIALPVDGSTATVTSDSAIAVMFPDYEAKNYDETQTGLGFCLADGTYLHLNSSKMNFNTTAQNGLFTVAKAYTNNDFALSVAETGKYIAFDASNHVFTMANSKTNATKLYIFAANTLDITYNDAIVNALTLAEGAEGTLGYVLNVNAANAMAEWASDNEDTVLIIPETGEFVTGASGTANITLNVHTYDASYQNYKLYTATIPVTVGSGHIHSYNDNGICTCGEKLFQITSASLRLDGDIDVIYTATIPEGATASMTFTMNGTSVTVNGTDSFLFEGVNPQCMGDTISAALRVTVGDRTYTCTKDDYSVRQYCVNLLASENISAEIRTLISDMLAYGAAAQTYMSYKTDALVNVGADIVNPTYTSYAPISGLGAALSGTALTDTRWVSAGLTLTNSVAMRFRFYAENISGLSVKVTINGREQTFTQFTAVEGKENYYEISFDGISAEEFADNVTASFYRSGAAIGSTLTYSVNAYVCAKQNAENTSLANLVKALYCYGVSAKAYGEIANT